MKFEPFAVFVLKCTRIYLHLKCFVCNGCLSPCVSCVMQQTSVWPNWYGAQDDLSIEEPSASYSHLDMPPPYEAVSGGNSHTQNTFIDSSSLFTPRYVRSSRHSADRDAFLFSLQFNVLKSYFEFCFSSPQVVLLITMFSGEERQTHGSQNI